MATSAHITIDSFTHKSTLTCCLMAYCCPPWPHLARSAYVRQRQQLGQATLHAVMASGTPVGEVPCCAEVEDEEDEEPADEIANGLDDDFIAFGSGSGDEDDAEPQEDPAPATGALCQTPSCRLLRW